MVGGAEWGPGVGAQAGGKTGIEMKDVRPHESPQKGRAYEDVVQDLTVALVDISISLRWDFPKDQICERHLFSSALENGERVVGSLLRLPEWKIVEVWISVSLSISLLLPIGFITFPDQIKCLKQASKPCAANTEKLEEE